MMCGRRVLVAYLLAVSSMAPGVPPGKMEGPLQALFDAWKMKGGAGLRSESESRRIEIRARRVSVRIAMLNEGSVPLLREFAIKEGGRLITVQGSSMFAEFPVSRLGVLAARTDVIAVYLDRAQHADRVSRR